MWIFRLFPIVLVGLSFGSPDVLAKEAKSIGQNFAGRYERAGIVDQTIDDQYKGLGIVLVPPVFIDELLSFPRRGTREDIEFILHRQSAGYEILLPKIGISCALADLGNVIELADGVLLLRRSISLTGEGRSPIHGDQEDRFSTEKREGIEWLAVETRIEWTRRLLFWSKKVEYRSLVRFRKLGG